MRILLQGRSQPSDLKGGDSTVHERIAQELHLLGHHAVVSLRPVAEDVASFDVVHAINLDRSVLAETEMLIASATRAGKPVFLTPLWWPLDSLPVHDFDSKMTLWLKSQPLLRAIRDRRLSSLRSLRSRQMRVLESASLIMATGVAEKVQLEKTFGPMAVIQEPLWGTDASPSNAVEEERSGVICVGRLDPRKNQLTLIEAIKGTGLHLTLIGTHKIFPRYARRCQEAAGPEVSFAGYLPKSALQAAYRRARVHALPSLFELPGLTSLDAAASGATVVVSRAGTPVDYLGRDATYCDTDVASIRQAVLRAYAEEPDPAVAERIASTYTWARSARLYLDAYEMAGI